MTRNIYKVLRGFTLVEMLVVIGIVAILAALLLPAVMRAMNMAKNTAIAVEVNQLASAIEAYKQDKGDYPPNFRDPAVVTRHIRKCYPKIDPTYFTGFMGAVYPAGSTSTMPVIDEGECLVFWLSLTDADPRYPFLSFYNPSGGSITANPKKYYDFDETRKVDGSDADTVPSYAAKYSNGTNYIYIDSRSYFDLAHFTGSPYSDTGNTYAYSEDDTKGVRPYWSEVSTSAKGGGNRATKKPMNPTTFQIICSGQDGEFGALATDVKIFPNGDYYDTAGEDKDNITNFSDGKTLGDLIK